MLTRLLTLALVAASWHATDACSCSPNHPQTDFCQSDFVIVGRVQKLFRGSDFLDAYKVKIRNTFKVVWFTCKAYVHLCGYVNKWREVTPRQRKGFRLLYKQGCTCKVHVNRRSTKSPNTCVMGSDDCFERHGICLHDRERRCRWTRAPALTRCLQKQHFNSTMT